MRLNTVEMGEGPPVALLHGLFGQARNFGAIQRHLAARRRVLAMDLRNHGANPETPGMSYAQMAADVAETLAARGATPAAVIGHSMGGKVAMALALRQPEMLSRLVVADIAPRRYPPRLRAHVAALRALPLSGGMTRREADALLAPSLPDPALRGFLLQSLDFESDPPHWRLGLAAIAAGMAEIEGFDAVGRFEKPTLILAGARSDYIRAEDRALFLRLFPAARFAEITEAGHWLHADNPGAFTARIEEFLA
jgi:pimeloyl-ACP methyl ester carboxylesterase